MSIFSLIAYDYNLDYYNYKKEHISFSEYIHKLVTHVEDEFVENIINDVHEHDQAFLRWAIKTTFYTYTGVHFNQLPALILRYIKLTKYNSFTRFKYSDMYIYENRLKNETKFGYKERLFSKYFKLVPSFYEGCVNKKHQSKLKQAVKEYFVLKGKKEKTKCEQKYNAYFDKKILW